MSIKVQGTLQELVRLSLTFGGCFRQLDFFKKTFILETFNKIYLLIIQPLQ